MASTTNVVSLSPSVDSAIIEKSSALDWERIVRSWLLILLIAIGIGGSIWGFYQEVNKEKTRVDQAFQTRSLQQANAVKSYLESTLSAMKSSITDSQQSLKSNVGEDVDQRLRGSIKNMLNSQHVLRSAAWLPNGGGGQFRIRSIFYSPFYGARTDELVQEQDLALIPAVKRSMDEVLADGRVALASLGAQKNVVALIPVYASDRQATRQQRSENLAGFVVATLDMVAVIEVGLQHANLFDTTTEQSLLDVGQDGSITELYARHREDEDGSVAPSPIHAQEQFLSHETSVKAGGASWKLRFGAPYGAYGREIPLSAWIVLAVGLLITGAISAFAASLTRSARIEKVVHKRTAELKEAHEKVRESELLLIQAEKLSSLGEMVAGVAHEINTPLGFIRCNLEMMKEQFEELQTAGEKAETQRDNSGGAAQVDASSNPLVGLYNDGMIEDLSAMVSESTEGIERISEIVMSLKDFSRMDRLNFDEVDIHRCIDSTLNIAHNRIKHSAKVVKDYGQLPLVTCASGQINQVLLNIIVNAAQAIEGFGEIIISTRAQGDKVSISIQDNGKGMSEATMQKIFQPFFTTKDVGKGTGLGLSISDKIIRQHNGEILIDSTEGVGTTFTIVLPVRQVLAKAA